MVFTLPTLFTAPSLSTLFISLSLSFLFSFSLSDLSFSLNSLHLRSMTVTMVTRSVGPLCTHSSDFLECKSAWALAHSCRPNMFASCKKQLFKYSCANLGMKWACFFFLRCAIEECPLHWSRACLVPNTPSALRSTGNGAGLLHGALQSEP